MSILGTGVAAGVAQTTLQAQQVARERDRRATQRVEEARRLKQIFEVQLRAIEEGEDAALQVRITPDLPDRPTPEQDRLPHIHAEADTPAPDASTPEAPVPEAPSPASPSAPLYRHLDIKA